ncbi:MAG: hypothetical protein P8X73_07735, partial [Ignavibacteriaceae bacterium]
SFGSLPVLLPGVGAQGGKLEDVIVAFESANRSNFLINISRGILYKSSDKDFAEKASEELVNLNKRVDSVLNETY